MDRNAPIGVFDSGVGGLTVAREIMRQMPEERLVYFPTEANPRKPSSTFPDRFSDSWNPGE